MVLDIETLCTERMQLWLTISAYLVGFFFGIIFYVTLSKCISFWYFSICQLGWQIYLKIFRWRWRIRLNFRALWRYRNFYVLSVFPIFFRSYCFFFCFCFFTHLFTFLFFFFTYIFVSFAFSFWRKLVLTMLAVCSWSLWKYPEFFFLCGETAQCWPGQPHCGGF